MLYRSLLCRQALQISRTDSYYAIRRLKTTAFGDLIKTTSAFPACRSFSSTAVTFDSNDSERRYIQARATTIVPSGQPGSNEDFDVQHISEKIKKVDLCKKYNLQPRDLGALEVDIIGRRAQIFVRPGTIVYSADIRAIIRRNKLLLFETDTHDAQVLKEEDAAKITGRDAEEGQDKGNGLAESTVNKKVKKPDTLDLAETLRTEMRRINIQGTQTMLEGSGETVPFEFVALEALLGQTSKGLFKTADSLQERYQDLMQTLKDSDQIPTTALQKMLEIKDAVEEFKSTSEEFRQAVSEILREETDMAQMYLTDTQDGKAHAVGDDDEIELLLEMYRHHAYSLTDLATTLLTRLQSITNHVTLLLSSTRNRLLNLEIAIAFTTLGTSVGGLIGALFGMNLTTGLEEAPYVFAGVSVTAIVLALIIVRWGRRALRNARSVKGEQQGLLKHTLPGLRKRLASVHERQKLE